MREHCDPQGLRDALGREPGQTVAFVPTMGALHRGHLRLVERAKREAQRVVVSIYVNPMQFGENEDLQRYPRDLERDRELLRSVGADELFLPSQSTIYPRGLEDHVQVRVRGLSEMLCGASRPGHFTGVATIVTKLLNLVRPECALFGEKDYQQLQVIRRVAADLCIPCRIVAVPTQREPDGLALSSRNGYLDRRQRALAPMIYAQLRAAASRLREAGGARHFEQLAQAAKMRLEEAGFALEYFELRDADSLQPPDGSTRKARILAAATIGDTRLIDNVAVDLRGG